MNDPYFVSVITGGTVVLMVVSFTVLAFYRWNMTKKAALQRVEDLHRIEKERLQTAILEEHERAIREFATGVHDDFNPLLAIAHMNVQFALSRQGEDIRSFLEDADEYLTMLVHRMKNITRSLSADHIKQQDLIEILSKTADDINSMGKIACHFSSTGQNNVDSPDKVLLLIRIAQEAISNATKHSNCTELDISLEFGESINKMEISDNGSGITPEKLEKPSGIGLMNMHSRARNLNGDLTITSSNGVTVSLNWPA